MRTWRLDLDSDAHAPRLARHSLRSWLELVACDDDTKTDVTILVSEFVTDAVTSDAARVSVRMVFDDGRLRVDVHAQYDQPLTSISANEQPRGTSWQSLTDRVAEAATDAWGRACMPHETHSWAEILC
jgi:hypothetical protein